MCDNLVENFLEQKAGKQTFNSLPLAVYVTDLEGRIKYYNSAAEILSGRKPVLDTDRWSVTWKLYHSDGTPMPPEESPMASFLKDEDRSGEEVIAERPDGKRVWLKAYPSWLYNDDGKAIGVLNILVDITNQKENEKQLKQNKEELTTFFDNAAVGFHQTGADGIIKRANKTLLNMLGYTREEFIGTSIADYHADQEAIEDIMEKISAGKELQDYEIRLKSKDGSIHHLLLNSNGYWKDGEFIHTQCITRDITKRKQAEEALSNSEEKYRTLFERMNEGFVILKMEFNENDKPVDWRYLETNPAANKHSGLNDRKGKKISEVLPDLDDSWFEIYGDVALTGKSVQFESFNEILQRWFDISAFRIGKPEERNVAVLFTDITARKEKELINASMRAIVDNSEDAIISKDLDGIITSWNNSAERIFGYTAEEAIGQPITIIIPEERLVEETEILNRIKNGERANHYETVRKHKDGTLLDVSLTISPVKDAEGTIVGASKIARDITDRKQTEEALRKNEEKYRTLVENFPNGAVALFDKELRYTALGGRLVKSVGVDPEDRIGNKISDLYPDEVVDELEPHFRAALEGNANSFEMEIDNHHLIIQTLPVENDNEEVISGMVVVLDITERWEAQKALKKSEEKYRSLFESMNEGFCIIQMEFDDDNEPINFHYLETNPAYKKHSGLDNENVEGKSAKEVFPYLGKDMLRRNGKIALTGEPFHDEIYVEEIDRWLDLSSFRIGDPEERKVAVLFTNITERKQAQQELKAVNENLEDRVKERTQELLSYQDQLRSLAFQLSRAEETQRQQLASELHDNLGQILALGKMKVNELQNEQFSRGELSAIDELKKIIDNAITYTRELTSDLKPPPSVNNDIKASINWLAEKMAEHGLSVTVQDDNQPKPLDTEVRTTVFQSVRELLFNVIKHTSVNKATVELKCIGNQLRIIVEDKGKGFALKDKKLASVENGRFGLFNILERIDLIGGQVNIEAKRGSGTKITLDVPLSEKVNKQELLKKIDQGAEISGTKTIADQQDDQIKVLLVDDHKMFRNGLRKIIEDEENFLVVGEAGNGEDAIKLSRETSPDIILMDVNMPKMDGVEATRKITATMPGIRIIGVSLHDSQEVMQDMRNAGASAYLTKTEAFESLIVTIRAEASASTEK